MKISPVISVFALLCAGCAHTDDGVGGAFSQPREYLLAGEVMAVAYSGFREGQHPDRGNGAVNPSKDEILEDLEILVANGFGLIRLYDSGDNSSAALSLIREHDMPIKVLLGIWLDAEVSNHEGCPWLDEPIPEERLAANALRNAEEIRRGIRLAQEFGDIVVAVNVGNEALVDWNDHMVPLEQVIAYVRKVKAAIDQPVTVADNYEWWIEDGAPLAAEVDFLGIHTYPAWEEKTIDEALGYTIENMERVQAALPTDLLSWETAGVDEGWHELRVVAVEDDAVALFVDRARQAGAILEEDDAERIEIRPTIDRLAENRFGRDVGNGAADLPRFVRETRLRRQAEVRQLQIHQPTSAADEQVGRFDVTVDQARRVHVIQSVKELHAELFERAG